MSVAGNDLAGVQSRPNVLLDSLVRRLLANLTDHLLQPEEHFLISQTEGHLIS